MIHLKYSYLLHVGELCYWIDQSNSWITGEKATINIRLDKDYDDWNVTFAYNEEVVNLEAWKGDVTSVNQSTYNVQSRCYNSKLYACQGSITKRIKCTPVKTLFDL